MAGMTSRFVKSPVAPKMTSVHGGAADRRPVLPDSAIVQPQCSWSCDNNLRPPVMRRAEGVFCAAALAVLASVRLVRHLFGVPAELLAHRRQHLLVVGM